jgi:hypothetical protein
MFHIFSRLAFAQRFGGQTVPGSTSSASTHYGLERPGMVDFVARQRTDLSVRNKWSFVAAPRQSAASCPPQPIGGGGSPAVCRQPLRGSTFGCFSDFLILDKMLKFSRFSVFL